MSLITSIQKAIGVTQDDIWGPKSQEALIKSPPAVKAVVQGLLKVTIDKVWGPKSQEALNAALAARCTADSGWQAIDASSFADPADVAAFNKCKATGKSDLQCFAVGDNGIGQFGKVTAQDHTPMVAVHKTAMVARWGSVAAAAHRPVRIKVGDKIIEATVEDRISAHGRIDLNPACAKLLGLRPPFVVPSSWQWA